MSRTLLLIALVAWGGFTLLLGELRSLKRMSLTERLRPYVGSQRGRPARVGVLSVASFREVMGPLVASGSERMLALLGVNEELSVKLARLHAPLDVTAFRLRQAAWTGASLTVAVLVVLAAGVPPLFGVLFVLGAPVLAFLLVEQRLNSACTARQTRLFNELPVIAEQLGMLLGAGYSLGSALNRLARRGNGVIAQDLQRVSNRVRQGLSEEAALREWSAIAAVVELERLVNVLTLNRQGADLGRLVAEEARSIRRQAHRRTIETIEKRAQLVWIPVTIATLVPGVMFMAIPFIEAMRTFAAL
ncbi:MAG: type II secretion system F family protein [Acidimicrobiales bacterium]